MNAHTPPPRGHNNPPDLLDEALGTDPEALELAEGILTGQPVENDDQLRAVDDITKRLKAIKKAVTDAKGAESKPLHDAWKAALARYKPTEDDLDRQIKGCVGMVDAFKRRKAAEQAERERQANMEAARLRREAEEAVRAANVSDLDAQRAADAAKREADEANRRAAAVKKDAVKGMRTVTRYSFTEAEGDTPEGRRLALNWIAVNDRDALTAFIEEYARRHHKEKQIAGVRVWQEKEAY